MLHDRHLLAIVFGLVCLDVVYITAWEVADPITSYVQYLGRVRMR